jgi:hypothetical protein
MIDKLGLDGLGGASVRVVANPPHLSTNTEEPERCCPNCKADLDGDLIFDTGMEMYGTEENAIEYASFYGATKTEGRWGREIAIYDRDKDRTTAYRCPDCGHEWSR